MWARSYLYVPADRADRLAEAPERGADALIVDLEDGVAPSAKDAARANAAAFLQDAPGIETWVRVNDAEPGTEDVGAVAGPHLSGIVVPKATSVQALRRLDAMLNECPGGGDVKVVPLIESGAGVLASIELAQAPRVVRLALGEADLCADLGVDPSPGEPELLPIRMHVVVASAAAEIHPPTGPVSTDFHDLDAYRTSTEALQRMGFGSRSAIHPAQIDVIHEVFTPSDEEVARARRLVELFEAAGGGVGVGDDGRMIDEAVVRSARRILARART